MKSFFMVQEIHMMDYGTYPYQNHHQVPYTFTSLGYKDQNGKWYVGLRMNIDQVSPLKLRPMNADTNLTDAWAEMMREFVKEFVLKHKQ